MHRLFPLLRIVVTGNATKSRLNAYKSVDRRRMEKKREEKTTEKRHKYKNLSVVLRQATDEHCNVSLGKFMFYSK